MAEHTAGPTNTPRLDGEDATHRDAGGPDPEIGGVLLAFDGEEIPHRVNLGSGPDYREDWVNVDVNPASRADVHADLNETPWPLPTGHFDRVLAAHVFEHLADVEAALRECARILRPGGRLDVRMPVGADKHTDPTHVPASCWHWDEPDRYCGREPWDVDVGLRVVHKDVDVWTHHSGVLRKLHRIKLGVLKTIEGNGRWAFNRPATSGEFRVIFQSPLREANHD